MHIFLFLDYDGTLVPVRSTPDKAVIAPETKRLLKELDGNPLISVTIVSGRSLENIKSMIGLRNLTYVGNHGLEIEGPKIKRRIMAGKSFRKAMARISGQLRDALSAVKGAAVENKGLTLSLHFRRVPSKMLPMVMSTFAAIADPYVRADKIRISRGKKVLEVKPAVDWDKGKAVQWILEILGATPEKAFPLYIGDDTTDEPAFKALGGRGLTVFVGRSGVTNARYRLGSQRQVVAFLKAMKEACSARK